MSSLQLKDESNKGCEYVQRGEHKTLRVSVGQVKKSCRESLTPGPV